MKWVLFAISLYTLWVSFNALFMMPGHYTAFEFEAAAVGITIGIATAWLSSKKFADGSKSRKKTVLMQIPMLLCILALVIFCVLGALKFAGLW
ncbi:MAG TPA: hypothetical protein VKH81_08535 [Candidatus Angelobacter sp.]|nr:hypothetical protein [Candidatus Angelobacter sp.]